MTTHTREYGVRYWWPGEDKPHVTTCADIAAVTEEIEDLAARGVTRMEPVTRLVPGWDLEPDGLPAIVRVLAEAADDDEIDYGTVRSRLAGLLRVDPLTVMAEWRKLLRAVEVYRQADDGAVNWDAVPENLRDPEKYVQHCDRLVDAAVTKLLDRAKAAVLG